MDCMAEAGVVEVQGSSADPLTGAPEFRRGAPDSSSFLLRHTHTSHFDNVVSCLVSFARVPSASQRSPMLASKC